MTSVSPSPYRGATQITAYGENHLKHLVEANDGRPEHLKNVFGGTVWHLLRDALPDLQLKVARRRGLKPPDRLRAPTGDYGGDLGPPIAHTSRCGTRTVLRKVTAGEPARLRALMARATHNLIYGPHQ